MNDTEQLISIFDLKETDGELVVFQCNNTSTLDVVCSIGMYFDVSFDNG